MKKISIWLLFSLIVAIGFAGCQSKEPNTNPTALASGHSSNSNPDAIPISWLLQAVPSGEVVLSYSDISTLSASVGLAIPSRQAAQPEKLKWWNTIYQYILGGYGFAGVPDLWGFDVVDLQGMLNFNNPESSFPGLFTQNPGFPRTVVLGGHLDTKAFRSKMRSYQLTEETYLGCTIFSGVPQAPLPSILAGSPTSSAAIIDDYLPRAMGVIDNVQTGNDTVNLILMVERLDSTTASDIPRDKALIQASLQAYQEKTSAAYQSGGVKELANALEGSGSVFIGTMTAFEQTYQELMRMQHNPLNPAEIAPISLGRYNRLALTSQVIGPDTFLEFILEYSDSAAAKANIEPLTQRITNGHSLNFQKTLTGLNGMWAVQSVKVDGTLLRATVKVIPSSDFQKVSLKSLIFLQDYWFLYPF